MTEALNKKPDDPQDAIPCHQLFGEAISNSALRSVYVSARLTSLENRDLGMNNQARAARAGVHAPTLASQKRRLARGNAPKRTRTLNSNPRGAPPPARQSPSTTQRWRVSGRAGTSFTSA